MVEVCSRRLSWKERARRDTATAAMYRLFIPVLLMIGTTLGAPQEPNKSGETYVKIEPINETTFQNLSPNLTNPIKLENTDFDRDARSDDITTEDQPEATTEIAETVTEKAERDQKLVSAEEIKTRTKTPSPRFFSKLSYFQKPNYENGPSVTNYLERNSKRKFKSRCRCEKIWNCPKLQITVPRCPDEYFMCCF